MNNPHILQLVTRLNILKASVERKSEQLQALMDIELNGSCITRQEKYEWIMDKKHSLRRVQALFNSVLEDLSAHRLTVYNDKPFEPVESCGVMAQENFADMKKE